MFCFLLVVRFFKTLFALNAHSFCHSTAFSQSASVLKTSPTKSFASGLLILIDSCVCVLCIFSGILSALGNLLSQFVEARKKAQKGAPVSNIDAAGAARYAIYG